MEYLDIVDENGKPTGKTVSREEAHAKGIMHRTAHVWIVRPTGDGYEVLLHSVKTDNGEFLHIND